MQPLFQNQFFSRSMKQSFNAQVFDFHSDEYESALGKWLRASGKV